MISRQHTITELGKEKFYLAVSKSFSRIDPFTISRFGASWIWEISDWLNSASNFPVSSSFSGLMGNFPAGPMSIAVPKPDAIPRPFTWIVCWIFYQFETSIFIRWKLKNIYIIFQRLPQVLISFQSRATLLAVHLQQQEHLPWKQPEATKQTLLSFPSTRRSLAFLFQSGFVCNLLKSFLITYPCGRMCKPILYHQEWQYTRAEFKRCHNTKVLM